MSKERHLKERTREYALRVVRLYAALPKATVAQVETYALGGGSEITMAYMHAFKNSVTGPSNNPNFPTGGATETISLAEDSIGISWGKKF